MYSLYKNEYRIFKPIEGSWAPVAHAYNPSYSRGRDQKDHSLKQAQANSSRDPTLKKPNTKKGWWNGSRCRP
jgi:hypothetical protein